MRINLFDQDKDGGIEIRRQSFRRKDTTSLVYLKFLQSRRAYLIFNQNMDNTSSERLAEIADRFNTHCDAGNTQEAQASFDNMQGIIQQQIFEAQNSVQETSKG
ncbi:unnamed protein product [Rotaria magnacalcarata]